MTPAREGRAMARLAATPVVLLGLVLGLLAGALVAASPTVAATSMPMVTLGDSVPSGMRCGCTPFPQQYAALVARHLGRAVTMTDDAVAGATTESVLDQLGTASVRSAVRASGTVLVMVGANNFSGPFERVLSHQQSAASAYPPAASRVRAQLARIVSALRQLHPGIRVLVATYWNVVKDGQVGRRLYGSWGVQMAAQATLAANRALAGAVQATGAILVGTWVPFKGVHGQLDPTPLLASDGDHPDARGHGTIAQAFFRHAASG